MSRVQIKNISNLNQFRIYRLWIIKTANYSNLKHKIRPIRISPLSIQIAQLIRSIHKTILLPNRINKELLLKAKALAKCLSSFQTNMELDSCGYRTCIWTCGNQNHLSLKLYRRTRRPRPHKQSAADKVPEAMLKSNHL